MNHQIFISSYRNDFNWLLYCLKSCAKFCRGFYDKPMVAVPEADLPLATHMCKWAHFVRRPDDPVRGMMSSQCAMLYADNYCPKADFVHLMGSDFFVMEDYVADDFLHGGKPVIHRMPYSWIKDCPVSPDHFHIKNWQRGINELFHINAEFEYMNCSPFLYPRPLYEETRKQIQAHSGRHWSDYVLNAKKTLFSEQNVLGYVADRWLHDIYHFQLNPTCRISPVGQHAAGVGFTGLGSTPPSDDTYIYQKHPIMSFWSWGGLDYSANGRETPRRVIERVLGEVVP